MPMILLHEKSSAHLHLILLKTFVAIIMIHSITPRTQQNTQNTVKTHKTPRTQQNTQNTTKYSKTPRTHKTHRTCATNKNTQNIP